MTKFTMNKPHTLARPQWAATSLLALLSIQFMASTSAASELQYTELLYACACQDTGLECEGGERLDVKLSSGKAEIHYGEKDGSNMIRFDTVLNPKYKSRILARQGFRQFKIRSSSSKAYQIDRSNFMIGLSLINGAKEGTVLFDSVQAENTGGGFWTWEFSCKLKSYR
jgi:hypothetical protein